MRLFAIVLIPSLAHYAPWRVNAGLRFDNIWPTGECTRPLSYSGGVLGVAVQLQLYETRRYAELQLQGIPVGGRIEGTATFAADGRSVVMDKHLERALQVRLCAVRWVKLSGDKRSVTVALKLPLFGKRTVTLQQDTDT